MEERILAIEQQVGTWSESGLRTLDDTPAVIPWTTKAVTAAYTVEPFVRVVLADATSVAFAVTLPDAYGKMGQQPVTVKRMNSGANAVTVASAGGTIDGATTVALSEQYATRGFVSDGTNWYVVTAAYSVGGHLNFGTGAPAAGLASDGDFYFRSDGAALTTIYQKRAGVWVGVV
jgi:hypothetical protein